MNSSEIILPTYLGKDGYPMEYHGEPLSNPYVRETLSDLVQRLKICDWLNFQLWPILVNVNKNANSNITSKTSYCYEFYFEYKDEKKPFHIREFDANFSKSVFFKRLPLRANLEAKRYDQMGKPLFKIKVTMPIIPVI